MSSDVIKILADLIEIETVNPPNERNQYKKLINKVESWLPSDTEIGEIEGELPTLIASRGEGRKHIVFNGHTDVVPVNESNWDYDPFSLTVGDDRVFGRGVSDMKGGLASLIQAFREFDPGEVSCKVSLVANPDEETGGKKGILDLKKRLDFGQFDFWLVAEPTKLSVNRCEKGAYWFEVSARGKSSHGSRPNLGINAIDSMSELIISLRKTTSSIEKEHAVLGKPTINTGTIQGGSKVNVVPDECEAQFDRRTIPDEDLEEVERTIKEIVKETMEKRETDWDIRPLLEAEAFEIPKNDSFIKICSEAVKNVEGEYPKISGTKGFTDARVPAALGISTAILGPGNGEMAHTANESASIKSIEEGVEVYKEILTLI